MSSDSHNTLLIKATYKKIFALLLISFLLFICLNPINLFTPENTTKVKAEVGAPPINGTTLTTWYIDSGEVINRSHENIFTQEIILNSTGIMNWKNITADINGEIHIKPGATLNLTDCNLTLAGNLSINGNLNMINSTILVNCSSMGEFFISVERFGLQTGGSLRLVDGSSIIGPANTYRIRILWVDSGSNLFAENSSFRYIGWNPNYRGIFIEANGTQLKNCSFSYCYPGVIFSNCYSAVVENTEFRNCQVGLNFSNSKNNNVRNCTFRANDIGIYGVNSSQNNISEVNVIGNYAHGIYFGSFSNYNKIEKAIIENNSGDGIYFENLSNNNNVNLCQIRNNNESGIVCIRDSNEIVIMNTSIENNKNGIWCENNSKVIFIINSSVQNSSSFDYYLAQTSELISLNTSFTNNKTQVDVDSNLTVQWFLHVHTLNSTLAPIPNVAITLWDNENGSLELNFTTNNLGWKRWINCTEFYETGNFRINLTPHTLRAIKFGYGTNTTNLSISYSQILNITMNRTIPLLPDLAPVKLSFSNPYPRYNQSITIVTEIKNVGLVNFDTNLTNVTMATYIDSALINLTTNISSIPSDESIEVPVLWTVNVTNGSHIVYVEIDIDDNLTELNNTNNSIYSELIVNSIPIAILKVDPNQTLTYENIFFNASESYNNVTEIGIQAYFYDFGDGNNSGWISNSTLYHHYTDDGIYLVRVKVQDLSSQISNWSGLHKVEVLNRAPVANFTIGPLTGTVNTEFTFNPESSKDIDGYIVNYYWELSDGTNSSNQTLIHKFEDDIEYTISLLLLDDDGEQSELYEKKITVQNLPPVANFKFSPKDPNATEQILFDATDTSDPDDEPITLNYTWDFDDGTFGYNLSIIRHNYSTPGIYNITLYVRDDDGDSGNFIQMLTVNKTTPKPSNDSDGADMLWAVGLVVIVLIIFVVLILMVFITQSRKLRRQLSAEQDLTSKSTGFTTAGKLDFVILKKPIGKRYVKFELHSTTKSDTEHLGVVWKSALINSSWIPIDKMLDAKDKVVDYLQLKIMAYENKGWVIDYSGNGTILKNQKEQVIKPVPIKSLGLDKPSEEEKGKTPTEDLEEEKELERDDDDF